MADPAPAPVAFLVVLPFTGPGTGQPAYYIAARPEMDRTVGELPTAYRAAARRFTLAEALPLAEGHAEALRQQSAPGSWLPVGAFLEVA